MVWGSYVFEYCLINEDFQYLIENHLICIRYVKIVEIIEKRERGAIEVVWISNRVIKKSENSKIYFNLFR